MSGASGSNRFAALLTDRGPGGRMVRIVLPAAVAIMVVTGLAIYAGHRLGFVGIAVGAAVFAMVNSAVVAVTVIHSGLLIRHEYGKRLRLQEQLRSQSLNDPMTGLANRGFFIDQLTRRSALAGRRTGVPFAVCILEVDNFRRIGEQLGQDAGNRILVNVGAVVHDCVRASDVVARLDDDRFGILLEEIADPKDVHVLAERIVSTVPRTLAEMGSDAPIQVSIGIALKSSGRERPEDLLRDADVALAEAKKRGPGRFELIAYG